MALAQRATVYLEAEEAQEAPALQLKQRPSQQTHKQTQLWQRPIPVVLVITIAVFAMSTYIAGNAYIAKTELRRQVLEQEMSQLARAQVQNRLTLDRLAARPLVIKNAFARGLDQPTADRIHYVRVAGISTGQTLAAATPDSTHASWRRQIAAAFKRLSHGPGDAAPVQE